MTRSLVGTRWEDSDPRQGDRVIRIIEDPLVNVVVHVDAPEGHKIIEGDWKGREVRYEIQTAQYNPSTIGDKRHIKVETLEERYRKISR